MHNFTHTPISAEHTVTLISPQTLPVIYRNTGKPVHSERLSVHMKDGAPCWLDLGRRGLCFCEASFVLGGPPICST